MRLALQGKGGFKASSVKMDNVPYALTPSLDFEAPVQGKLSFLYNSFMSSQLTASTKVYLALAEMFAKHVRNTRREVLVDMVCKGSLYDICICACLGMCTCICIYV